MTSYATRTQTSTEQNDLKKLKSKYSSKLTTLKELFADWSDEDLLFALDEADGVLEVAVDRISEGHATQWGEVKTKKAKKEAQQKAKAAAAAAVPSSAQTMSYQKPERSYTERPKPAKARVSSINNYSRKSTTTTTTTNHNNNNNASWGYNSGHKPSSSSILDTSGGGSWASIASTKPAHDSSSDWNTTTTTAADTATATTNDPWTQPSWSGAADDKEITETTTSSALLDDSEKPKSWASLLKSQAKPEEEQQQNTKQPENNDDAWNTANDEPVNDAWNTTKDEPVDDTWNTANDEPVKDEWNAPVEVPTNAWGASTTEPVETKVAREPVEDADESKKSARLLSQESPVVMPNNDVAVSAVDVKFGSLNLDESVAQEPTRVEESLTNTKVETQPQTQAPTEPTTEQNYTNNQRAQQTQQAAYVKQQEPTYSQPQAQQQQQPQTTPSQIQPAQPSTQPQQLPQQQQQPQQPFGMDHLTSAYSSYLPNQHPTGVSGFGMNPMANLPDYGGYGTEAQRAAAMGYYDPSTFNNSPSVTNASAYSSRDKFGQDTSASLGTPQGQQSNPGQNQGLHGQQMYPGMPYYPYYYMPNHYNAYQQSMYGQPMMNKNMYPNMYQQQAASASKPTTHSPYGGAASHNGANAAATASPYALHSQLYNQPSNVTGGSGSYDDLQPSFGGLHDYQKSSPYGGGQQQLHGFLGHPMQGQQQQQGQGQGQSVDPSKNDTTTRGVNATSSQPQQQQPQQQQQQQQHPMNYFGQQQQMFSYQQYPQQQYWNQ